MISHHALFVMAHLKKEKRKLKAYQACINYSLPPPNYNKAS